jgi:hypothetical protein
VDFDSASHNVLLRWRPFCFVITIGVDTKTVDIEETDEANWPQQRVYYMLGGRVNLKFSFYISSWHVGQDAVSKSQHAINTNLVAANRCVSY